MADFPKYLVYTDAPPLGGEGTGMSVLAHNFLAALGSNVSGYLTRRYYKRLSTELIGRDLSAERFLGWDCAGLKLRFVHGRHRRQLDHLLLRAWLAAHPAGRWRTAIAQADEVVGLSGSDWRFLNRLQLLAKVVSRPYSVYVVDDFEESVQLVATAKELAECRKVVQGCLRQASRVFAICPGMAARIARLYGIESQVLYPVADSFSVPDLPEVALKPRLVYVGSLNHLYLSVLREVADLLAVGHAEGRSKWKLHLITRDEKTFQREFANHPAITVDHTCDRARLRSEVACSELVLLPYSFDPQHRLMVESSFPSKFTDAIPAKRPILAYGPGYASIIHHLRMAGLPYVATSRSELLELLTTAPWAVDEKWRKAYADAGQRFHSNAAFRAVFLGETSQAHAGSISKSGKQLEC
jgi:hypothetical protein